MISVPSCSYRSFLGRNGKIPSNHGLAPSVPTVPTYMSIFIKNGGGVTRRVFPSENIAKLVGTDGTVAVARRNPREYTVPTYRREEGTTHLFGWNGHV